MRHLRLENVSTVYPTRYRFPEAHLLISSAVPDLATWFFSRHARMDVQTLSAFQLVSRIGLPPSDTSPSYCLANIRPGAKQRM